MGDSNRLPETPGGGGGGAEIRLLWEGAGGEKWTGLFAIFDPVLFDSILCAHILFELILVYPMII